MLCLPKFGSQKSLGKYYQLLENLLLLISQLSMGEKLVQYLYITINAFWNCNSIMKSAYSSQYLSINLPVRLLFMAFHILWLCIYKVKD